MILVPLFIMLFLLTIYITRMEGMIEYPRKSIDALADATFKPECCPTPYSSSSGCLCPTRYDAALITTRGGNRRSDECCF
jgi:hypothetical protein